MRRSGVVNGEGTRAAAGVAGLAGLAVVGFLVGAHPARSGTAAVVAPSGPVPVAPSSDPSQSALAWLRGYRTQAWTDSGPWSWTARVRAVVTGPLAGDYVTDQGVSGGQEWADYVARRCVTSVITQGAVIPPEAPRGPTEVYVQVAGDVLTRCAVGGAPGVPEEHTAATVEVVRGADGLWRVADRLF